MSDDIDGLHHVGLVVRDMDDAIGVYRRLGFDLDPPAYPMLPRDGGDPEPFGAANTHAYLGRNFLEVVTVVTPGTRPAADAKLVPIQAPPEHLPQITEVVERTVARFQACLARFEGLHRLVFATADADAVADRLTAAGVPHSGVNTIQRPVDTEDGPQVETIRHIEIAGGSAYGADGHPPEGILAVAEAEPASDQHTNAHPNGAVAVVDVILCVDDGELAAVQARYERYLGRSAQADGPAQVFRFDGSRLTIVAAGDLGSRVGGTGRPPALPALAAFAVAVRDLAATERLLQANGFSPITSPDGALVVPPEAARGAAVIFRQEG